MTKKMNSEIEEATVPVPSARDIEIGWIVAGRLDAVDRAAVEQARVAALEFMREHLPEFVWRMPLLRRVETADRTNLRVGDRVAELLTELHASDNSLFDPQSKANSTTASFHRVLTIAGATGVL